MTDPDRKSTLLRASSRNSELNPHIWDVSLSSVVGGLFIKSKRERGPCNRAPSVGNVVDFYEHTLAEANFLAGQKILDKAA